MICQNGQEKFAEHLVDGEASTVGEAQAGSSHEPPHPEPPPKVVSGKHSIFAHFPKDRNCDVCRRTEITRAPCRKRFGTPIHRAGNFGDLITADHKVFFDESESRNGHRYAVVVKDLATQWLQAYACKTKTSQETKMCLRKFLEPKEKPKVNGSDDPLESGKACENLSWNHCASKPPCSETSGIAERAVRRVKESTSVG